MHYLCCWLSLKITQQTNMTKYSKVVSTWLTGINTIIAVGKILSQHPLCTVTALHTLANMCGSCDHNLPYSVIYAICSCSSHWIYINILTIWKWKDYRERYNLLDVKHSVISIFRSSILFSLYHYIVTKIQLVRLFNEPIFSFPHYQQ